MYRIRLSFIISISENLGEKIIGRILKLLVFRFWSDIKLFKSFQIVKIKMMVESLNLLFLFFFLIIFSILINTNTALHLLLTAELLWITLYGIVLFIGLIYDNLNILSLTFFFLVFSAIEFGIGLILLLFQHIINRSINLSDNDINFLKFTNRFKTKLYANKINWKI